MELRTEGIQEVTFVVISHLSPNSLVPLNSHVYPFSRQCCQLFTIPYTPSPPKAPGTTASAVTLSAARAPTGSLSWSSTIAMSSADGHRMTIPTTSHLMLPSPIISLYSLMPPDLLVLTPSNEKEKLNATFTDVHQQTFSLPQAVPLPHRY
jgi:hypothetical protein